MGDVVVVVDPVATWVVVVEDEPVAPAAAPVAAVADSAAARAATSDAAVVQRGRRARRWATPAGRRRVVISATLARYRRHGCRTMAGWLKNTRSTVVWPQVNVGWTERVSQVSSVLGDGPVGLRTLLGPTGG